MAAIARFGFEGGNIPSNVSVFSASYVSGRAYANGYTGTAVEASASGQYDQGGFLVDRNSQVAVTSISSDAIYYSCQMKRVSANSNASMSLVQFGPCWVDYDPSGSNIIFKRAKLSSPGYDVLYTSPGTVLFPVGTWIPVSGQFVISSTGQISMNVDGTSYLSGTVNTTSNLSLIISSSTITEVRIPPVINTLSFIASGGGAGGNSYSSTNFAGGNGGYVSGSMNVKFGQKYWGVAGQGGGNGNYGAGGSPGGAAGGITGAGGGGYTGIFTSSVASTGSAVIIAGGGGGGTGTAGGYAGGNGGDLAASGSPLQGGSTSAGGGGGGYLGGNPTRGGSNFYRYDVVASSSMGGGAAGGPLGTSTGSNGQLTLTASYDKTNLIFGFGVNRDNSIVGAPTFQLDDIAVNNWYTASNSTGSVGVSDYSTPSFIACQLVTYAATGSNTIGWKSPTGDIISSISYTGSDGQYLTASFYPRPVLELTPSGGLPATTVEGINYYYSGVFREGSSNVYVIPHFMLNNTSSVQGQASIQLDSTKKSGSVSVFEKDLGGKLSYTEFSNGKIALDSTQWINKNFFGRGIDGDVRILSGTTHNGLQTDLKYTVKEYNNLIIDNGATLTAATDSYGLMVYVKGNCIINGTIDMNGGSGRTSNDTPLSSGLLMYKNTSSITFSEYSSSMNTGCTLSTEKNYQSYLSVPSSSAMVGIVPPYVASTNRVGGNGGVGGAGHGSPVSPNCFKGGVGASGDAVQANWGDGGGTIYIIVGGHLIIGGTGLIRANGTNAGAGGSYGPGGGGGGSINIFYGKNYYNSGTIQVNAGLGGNGGGASGGNGSAGSITVNNIITN